MEKITGAGSSREFYRVETEDGNSGAILMRWDGGDSDWDYFIALNEIHELRDIIPTIIEAKRSENEVLVRDCGRFTLKSLFDNAEKRRLLLEKTAEALLFWQSVKIPTSNIISTRVFTTPDLLWESDYFREHISTLFPATKPSFDSADFDRERNDIAREVDNLPKCLMHRDFQSENIVFDGDLPSFVDVQGVRIGPNLYDAASLLFDPYLYPLMTDVLREFFMSKLQITYSEPLRFCALQRLMQALGAYANLCSNKSKPQYRRFIKPAAFFAQRICESLNKYPVLTEIYKTLLK